MPRLTTVPSGKHKSYMVYSITCIQRPLKGSNESGLLHQVVFKCRFYQVDLTLFQTSPGFYVSAVQVF